MNGSIRAVHCNEDRAANVTFVQSVADAHQTLRIAFIDLFSSFSVFSPSLSALSSDHREASGSLV